MGVSNYLKKALFLDRDGVINEVIRINEKPYPPKSISEFRFINGVLNLLEDIRSKGFLLFIITNQPDVARGKITRSSVEDIHNYILETINIEQIYCCYHDDIDDCYCRKPKPGFFYEAEKDWNIKLSESFMIGDRWKDIKAAENANVNSIFIDYNYNEYKPSSQIYTCKKSTEALLYILNQ